MLKKIILILVMFSSILFANIQAHLESSINAYNNGDYNKAIEKATIVLNEDSSNVMANYIVGVVYYSTNNMSDAITYLEIAAKSDKAPEGTLETLNAAYIYEGYADKALPFFEKQYQQIPEDDFTMLHYGMALQYSGNTNKAIEIYRKILALEISNNKDIAKYNLAHIYLERKRYFEAKDLFHGIDATSAYYTQAQDVVLEVDKMIEYLSVYASVKVIYNDNPNLISDNSIFQTIEGSNAIESTFMINSSSYYLHDKFFLNMRYFFFNSSFQEEFAQVSDFQGHYISPILFTYMLDPTTSIDVETSVNLTYMQSEHYANQYKVKLGVTKEFKEGVVINTSFAVSQFEQYLEGSEYNEGLEYEFKLGSTFVPSASNIRYGLEYKYIYFDPKHMNDTDILLATLSTANEKDKHYISTDIYYPFSGAFNRLSLLANAYYIYTISRNNDLTYVDMIGKKLEQNNLEYSLSFNYLLNREYNINSNIGVSKLQNWSNQDLLDYESTKYFVNISLYY